MIFLIGDLLLASSWGDFCGNLKQGLEMVAATFGAKGLCILAMHA